MLAKENPRTLLVPTLDVDLIWHAHMLSPEDYKDDCNAVLGRLLAHDDAVSENKLEASFYTTHRLWQQRFGTEYVRRLSVYEQGTLRVSCGGCASRPLSEAHFGRTSDTATPVEFNRDWNAEPGHFAPKDVIADSTDVSEPVGWGPVDTGSSFGGGSSDV
jgi:hypothetical protein